MIDQKIIESFATKNNISVNKSKMLFNDLEKFFDKVVQSKKPISPREKLDQAWHHLILHTKYYTTYCQDTFGTFIHHKPLKTPAGFANCGATCESE